MINASSVKVAARMTPISSLCSSPALGLFLRSHEPGCRNMQYRLQWNELLPHLNLGPECGTQMTLAKSDFVLNTCKMPLISASHRARRPPPRLGLRVEQDDQKQSQFCS